MPLLLEHSSQLSRNSARTDLQRCSVLLFAVPTAQATPIETACKSYLEVLLGDFDSKLLVVNYKDRLQPQERGNADPKALEEQLFQPAASFWCARSKSGNTLAYLVVT